MSTLPINWGMLQHPSNWVIVFLMVFIAMIGVALLQDLYETNNVKGA